VRVGLTNLKSSVLRLTSAIIVGVISSLTLKAQADVTIDATHFDVGLTTDGNTVVSNWVGSPFAISAPVQVGLNTRDNTITISNYTITSGSGYIGSGTATNNSLTLLTNTTLSVSGGTFYLAGAASNSLTLNGGTLNVQYLRLGVGGSQNNSLLVTNGGQLVVTDGGLFSFAGNGGLLTVTGTGSVMKTTGTPLGWYFPLATSTSNQVIVSNGGKLLLSQTYDFIQESNLRVLVTGAGSVWSNYVNSGGGYGFAFGYGSGSSGNNITVSNGGAFYTLSPLNTYIGYSAGSLSNSVTVTGSGSIWSNDNNVIVGNVSGSDFNSILITNGGRLYSSGVLTVGGGNSNSVLVSTGGSLQASALSIVGGTGNAVTVNGGIITNVTTVTVGSGAGAGHSLIVTNGGQLFARTSIVVGTSGSSNNTFRIIGGTASSTIVTTTPGLTLALTIGDTGSGYNSMTISNAKLFTSSTATIGSGSSNNTATVLRNAIWNLGANNLTIGSGAATGNVVTINGGIITNVNTVTVGSDGTSNQMTIANAGKVVSQYGSIGEKATAIGNTVTITGSGSVWSNQFDLYVGKTGSVNRLILANGGALANAGSVFVGNSASAKSNRFQVGGTGGASTATVAALTIGANGSGFNSLTITNGRLIVSSAVTIGTGSTNSVTVNRLGLLQAGSLTIAGGTGNVVMINGGVLTLNGSAPNFNLFDGATTMRNSLIISNGGRLNTIPTTGYITYTRNGSYSNSIIVTGNGSVWSNSAQFFDFSSGGLGGDRITVAKGGLLVSTGSEFAIGYFTPDERLTITDAGSTARILNSLILGQNAASNAVIVANGGKLVSTAISIGGASGSDRNTLTVTGSGSVLSNLAGGSTTALRIGIASAKSNSLVISQSGKVYNDGDLTIGNSAGAFGNGVTVTGSGSVLTNIGSLIVGNYLLVPSYNFLTVSNGGKAFFANAYVGGSAANNALNSQLTVTGTGSFFKVQSGGAFHLGGGAAGGNDNAALINHGAVLEANSLTIRVGSTGNTISNRNATYQFTAAPTVTPNGGIISVTDGTISYRATTVADVRYSAVSGMQFAGANTFMLNAASNTAAAGTQTYTFDTVPGNPTNYANLVMVNGQTAYGNTVNGGNITIGSAGSMLISNTTATINGVFTNHGSVNIVNAKATYQSVVYNSGTNNMLNSVGTFNSGVINSGQWMTDPTTNVFQNFGLTNTASGGITMAAGDVYRFTNTQAGTAANFVNVSTNNSANDTLLGKFAFDGGLGLTQTFTVAGHDLGPGQIDPLLTATNIGWWTSAPIPGYSNNFALGTLEISNFSTVRVTDAFLGVTGLGSNDFLTAGLYLENLYLGVNSLLIIDPNVQVYFRNSNNWSLANIRLLNNQGSFYGDAYDYNNTISGLHQITVIPEPNVALLWLAGAATAYAARRRTRRGLTPTTNRASAPAMPEVATPVTVSPVVHPKVRTGSAVQLPSGSQSQSTTPRRRKHVPRRSLYDILRYGSLD